jgi:oxygen-independent coproporphyrinogen-3 oxidase
VERESMTTLMPIVERRREGLVETYTYGYPHKSLYGTLTPEVPLPELWAEEKRDALALYLHIPFCEMRCGFCNLFTLARPAEDLVARYIAQLKRQSLVAKQFLSPATFAECAVGGGTPTMLTPLQLETLLDAAEGLMGAPIRSVPTSVETSPATATSDRVSVLRDFGVRRVSLGIQATNDADLSAIGRPGARSEALSALDRLMAAGFPVLNVDLIYGFAGQTAAAWRSTVSDIVLRRPQEVFLYPLYVRPGTGLGRRGDAAQIRRDLYRLGRDLLLSAGYRQRSLRNFVLPGAAAEQARSCQRDGIVGLGCGARSYTERLHYSTPFAVVRDSIVRIVERWMADDSSFLTASHGVWLDDDERRRRHVILSLLDGNGLDDDGYARRFGGLPLDDFPLLAAFEEDGLIDCESGVWRLTDAGLERSDELGLAFYSDAARSALSAFLQ